MYHLPVPRTVFGCHEACGVLLFICFNCCPGSEEDFALGSSGEKTMNNFRDRGFLCASLCKLNVSGNVSSGKGRSSNLISNT